MKPLEERKERIVGRPGWEAKFPEFADAPNDAPLDTSFDVGGRPGQIPWTEAPGTSHLIGFRFIDARGQTTEGRIRRKFQDGRSELQVRFKATATQPATQYSYYFSDHSQGEGIFQAMKAAEHPGEVVHAELIKKRVPYAKTAFNSE